MVDINHLNGRRTKNHIFNKKGVLLVPANSILNNQDILKIVKHKIDLSAIELDAVEGAYRTSLQQRQLINDITNQAKDLLLSIRLTGDIPLLDIRTNIISKIEQASKNAGLFKIFDSLKANDDYTYRHSIAVGVLSMLIGKWMGLKENELTELTFAAMMHDVGKMKITERILHHPNQLTEKEFTIVRKHTVDGYQMLKEAEGVSHRIALTALQHHEREDGSGYPFGLKADKIDLFAKIVGIADVFHALSSDRVYKKASSTFKIIQEIQQDIHSGKFNAKIGVIFLNHMMEAMVGNEAFLSDDRRCMIVRINPFEPVSPLVQIGDEFIDLSTERHIHLRDVTGEEALTRA